MAATLSLKIIRIAMAPALFAVFAAAAHAQVSVVNAASFRAGSPVAPGSLATAFLGSPITVEATLAEGLPLPAALAGVQLVVDGTAAPLLFVNAEQINFQVPSGVTLGAPVPVRLVVAGAESQSGTLTATAAAPGIVHNPQTGEAVVLHGGDNSPVTGASPAARGEIVVLYGVGPGATEPPVADGAAAGGDPVSVPVGVTRAFIGGVEAETLFSGLAPGFVGLWQINVRVPRDGISAGAVPLLVTLDDVPANEAALQIAPQHSGPGLVLGQERLTPGIVMIFAGAAPGGPLPDEAHLAEALADIRIAARANWGSDAAHIPEGAPPGGFVAYLNVYAQITNETTGKNNFATLVPHVNLTDNLHYARNVALPGEPTDSYTVRFFVDPPDTFALALHRDWTSAYELELFAPVEFVYEQINFMDIANAPPQPAASASPNGGKR